MQAKFTLSDNELFMLNNALLYFKCDLKETIKIYSTGDIDAHLLDSKEEPTYKEEIEKLKCKLKKAEELSQKIQKAIHDMK